MVHVYGHISVVAGGEGVDLPATIAGEGKDGPVPLQLGQDTARPESAAGDGTGVDGIVGEHGVGGEHDPATESSRGGQSPDEGADPAHPGAPFHRLQPG